MGQVQVSTTCTSFNSNHCRTDPDDAYAWEGLADAYHARGSYSAAMKAYDKVEHFSASQVWSLNHFEF